MERCSSFIKESILSVKNLFFLPCVSIARATLGHPSKLTWQFRENRNYVQPTYLEVPFEVKMKLSIWWPGLKYCFYILESRIWLFHNCESCCISIRWRLLMRDVTSTTVWSVLILIGHPLWFASGISRNHNMATLPTKDTSPMLRCICSSKDIWAFLCAFGNDWRGQCVSWV